MTWMLPLSLAFALSLRTPNVGNVTDYEVSFKPKWDPVACKMIYEREDGKNYYGYNLTGEHGLFYGLDIQVRTQIKTAKDVDRQSVVIGRKFERRTGFFEGAWGGIGAGAVARYYSRPKGAIDLSMSLPGGRLIFTTDFNQVHIWDGETQFGFHVSERVMLVAIGKYFGDGDKMFWAAKGGVEIELK